MAGGISLNNEIKTERNPWWAFQEKGLILPNSISDLIARSWQRSHDFDVNWQNIDYNDFLDSAEMDQRLEEMENLLRSANRPMEDLYQMVKGLGYTVILADSQGYILRNLGDEDFLNRAQHVSLLPGASWNERIKGTNAIGTAISEKAPVTVRAWEHYCKENHFLVCYACPILDDRGNVLGVLDLTGDCRGEEPRLQNMVQLAAQNVEQGLLLNQAGRGYEIYSYNHSSNPWSKIVGSSKGLRDSIALGKKAAMSGANVLILGATGTGKELFAKAIHESSDVSEGPFVALNCGSIPKELLESELFGYEEGSFTGALRGGKKGKFELANAGTLFLDEIGDMPYSAQVSLLRVLQEKKMTKVGGSKEIPLKVRVIAATHQNLEELVAKGQFRQDLYYRLKVITLKIPSLKDRTEDVIPLAKYFVKKACDKYGRSFMNLSASGEEWLQAYEWPGNIRELENLLEGLICVLESDTITGQHLSKAAGVKEEKVLNSKQRGKTPLLTLREMEIQLIKRTMDYCEGNISATAKMLGIGRNTLYRKMREIY